MWAPRRWVLSSSNAVCRVRDWRGICVERDPFPAPLHKVGSRAGARTLTAAQAPSLTACEPARCPTCPPPVPRPMDRGATALLPEDNARPRDRRTAYTEPERSHSKPPPALEGPADERWLCPSGPAPNRSPNQETFW